MRALIIVDVQNDFCPGGALATEDGAIVAQQIANYVSDVGASYDAIVATKDWHIDPGDHFHDWPVHCVADSVGAAFHPAISPHSMDEVFLKGKFTAAYSGFEGAAETGTKLADWLRMRGITDVDVVGIATDYCVRATALDALEAGFNTRVLSDLCAAVTEDTGRAALAEMAAAGVGVDTRS